MSESFSNAIALFLAFNIHCTKNKVIFVFKLYAVFKHLFLFCDQNKLKSSSTLPTYRKSFIPFVSISAVLFNGVY